MELETVIYETREGVALLTLNRPEVMNALNVQMQKDLTQALSIAAEDGKIRVVILTGNGAAFCAGADLSIFKDDYEHFERTGEPSPFYDISLPIMFSSFPKALIAAVNGPAVGVGMTIALACDIRLCSEKTLFSVPFARIGLTPEFGSSYYLPRLVGYAKAAEWVFTGKSISAQEGLANGLVNQVVPSESNLLDEAQKMARLVASMPEEAIDSSKTLLRQGENSNLSETLERESEVFKCLQETRVHYDSVCELLNAMRGKKK